MKRFRYAILLLAFVACAKQDAATSVVNDATTESAPTSSTVAAEPEPEAAAPTTTEPPREREKPMSAYENKVAEIKTTKGTIVMRFYPDVAPNHVKNFIDLAEQGFYTNTKFHRVIPGFMIQGGDPNTKPSGDPMTWGSGGSGKHVKAEFSTVPHRRGIISMARANDPNSASSQFFIVVADSNFLDGKYSVFGEVLSGMDVADEIVNAPRNKSNDRPNDAVAIQSIAIRDAKEGEKGPAPK